MLTNCSSSLASSTTNSTSRNPLDLSSKNESREPCHASNNVCGSSYAPTGSASSPLLLKAQPEILAPINLTRCFTFESGRVIARKSSEEKSLSKSTTKKRFPAWKTRPKPGMRKRVFSKLDRDFEEAKFHPESGWNDLHGSIIAHCKRMRKPDVVCLNVGGKKFFTTLATLRKYEHSMFSKLFSGKYKLSQLDTDIPLAPFCCFIDRSPEVFHYILDYLRNGPMFVPPFDQENRQKLIVEAEYYSLFELAEQLRAPVKKTFRYSFDGDVNGIMYYLGLKVQRGKFNLGQLSRRSKKQCCSEEWTNPYVAGQVGITASEGMRMNLDSLSSDEEGEVEENNYSTADGSPNFDQIEGPISHMNYPLSLYCARPSQSFPNFPKNPFRFLELSSCKAYESKEGAWVRFDFGKRKVRMVRYTLRYGDCYGLGGCWDWEASNDLNTWDNIHRVRDDANLNCDNPKFPKEYHVPTTASNITTLKRLQAVHKRAMLCSHTFEIREPRNQFYRYYRIRKPQLEMFNIVRRDAENDEEAEVVFGGASRRAAPDANSGISDEHPGKHDQSCLHFWGFEVYGELLEPREI